MKPDWYKLSLSELGEALGLSSYRPFNVHDRRASFRELERARGKREPDDPQELRWYSGEADGWEIMLAPCEAKLGSDTTHDTAVVVRIHPPLHLGTWIARQGAWSWLQRAQVLLDDPRADAILLVEALESEALEAMLGRTGSGDAAAELRDALVLAVPQGAEITDSTVTYYLPGLHHHLATVTNALTRGAQIADLLTARRESLPELAFERSYRSAWERCARSRDLAFDPRALVVHGDAGGARVELAVDVTPRGGHITVTARWQQTLRDTAGSRLRMSVVPARQLERLERWFGQDVRVGDGTFDAAFVVRGEPEAEVREALSSAPLREAMLSIAGLASAVMLSDRGVFWQLDDRAARADAIDAQLDLIDTLSGALFGQRKKTGPYR